MKYKYLCLWVLAIPTMLTLTSCQKDDHKDESDITNSNKGKIENITYIYYSDYGNYTSSSKITYIVEWDGNKLKKITSNNGSIKVFNYDGDKLIEHFTQDSYGNIGQRYTYSYTNDLLTEIDGLFQINYDDDGHVVSASYIGSDHIETYQLTWQDGNLVKYVLRYERDTSRYTTTVTSTYDNKKSWRTGFGVFAFSRYNPAFNPDFLDTRNNETSRTFHVAYDSGSESTVVENYNYTYNGDYVNLFVCSTVEMPYTCYIKYTKSSDPAPTTYKVTARGDYGKGTVSGAGDYVKGKTVKLLAIPNEGYHFTSWSNGSTSNPLTFTVTSDVEYQATFEADN